ncbi:MAG: DsbA family protein [Rhodospirillales bacterium]|nr:DsbA family protein [Rhodospirillales bacterium]
MLNRRVFLTAAATAAVLPVVGARAQDPVMLPDMVLGDADAPIEIIEYASMTCSHCAAFHKETLPKLKMRYIDTGRARLVFREFPLDRVALAASAIARCSGEERFFPLVDVLFQTQDQWARSDDPIGAIEQIIRMGGQDPAFVSACLEDQEIINGILAIRLDGSNQYEISATPTFIVNGEKTAGNMSFEAFDELLRNIEGNV